tara:strand:+ start:1116 stop:1313 length:198 start_codon:yes stop_codon:yes gene_type:complete
MPDALAMRHIEPPPDRDGSSGFRFRDCPRKNIKAWKRAWKLRLIEASNPDWVDWFDTIMMWALYD